MSATERSRALALVAIVALALAGLYAYRSEGRAPQGVRDSLELCAASKGALCDEPEPQLAHGGSVAELGHVVVTSPRFPAPVRLATRQVADLGSITVSAPRA